MPTAAPRSRRAVLIGALLTAVSPLLAQTGRVQVRVTDMSGAVIPRAEISLLDADGSVLRKLETNEAGVAIWTDLPIGDNRFTVVSPGFDRRTVTVAVPGSGEVATEIALGVAFLGEIVVGKKKRHWWLF